MYIQHIPKFKYLFRKKSDVEVKESDIDTPIVTQTASINDFMFLSKNE